MELAKILFSFSFILVLTNGYNLEYMPKTAKQIRADPAPWELNDRLPNSTYADHYKLYLHPDLTTKTFTGHVTITITSSEDRDYFLVHSKQMTIDNSTISLKRQEDLSQINVPVLSAFEYTPNEFYVIETGTVPPGTYYLYLEFTGSLTGKIVGFYYSEYENEAGEKKSLATTKFEPTDARQAFPCFDEPDFRSTYTITIVRPSGNNYIGLSNMPVESEFSDTPSTGLTEVNFQTSVSMVTYLVCFIVSDFAYVEVSASTMDGVKPFRVYSPVDKLDDMLYALDFGSKTLQFYEILFDYPFPLPKSDMAAIPDYSSGATEHWGLITFRETNIFYNQNVSSTSNYQRVSSVIAHEMAHQWFGNLVTLKWWNDLWLNEGFASYIEYKGVDHEHSDWDMMAQFVVDNVQYVFDIDSQLSSHPIVKTVQTPDEINAMFDTISYSKGSSVLRMLEGFMGQTDFQDGVNQFIKNFAFQNAVTQDLWDELTTAWTTPSGSKADVGDIMNTWTMQMGYPVVTISRNNSQLTLKQARFLKDPNAEFDPANSTYGYKWDIPITLVTSNETNPQSYWLYREDDQLVIDIDGSVSWFKCNYRQIGYYRVNYSPEMWAELEVLCSSLLLTPEDRSSLYEDALALADAALLDFGVALNLTRSLVNENHYVPWQSAKGRFKIMDYLLLQTSVVGPFKAYVREIVQPIYDTLQWEDNGSHLDRLLRSVIVDLASLNDLESSLVEAGSLLQSWIDDASYSLPLDTKRNVYWWGMIRSGSNVNWNIMWQRCLAELDASQKNNLYYGLSNSQDTDTLSNYIILTFDLANTRMQDFLSVLEYISLNPAGTDLVWDWVRTNWDALIERYGPEDRYLGQLIPDISRYFATPEKLAQLELFYQVSGNTGSVKQYKDQAIETVRSNIYWVNTYSPVILEWLNARL